MLIKARRRIMMTKKQRRTLLALNKVLKRKGTNFKTFNRRIASDLDNVRRGRNKMTVDRLTSSDLITGAFTWEYTKEGHKFWSDVDSAWDSEYFKLRSY